ncbi:MAG: prepilin peptidase [Chthonomonadaceae bacterium]|nr:prepilin peptidase [Chthonomonadaceae bacterium]
MFPEWTWIIGFWIGAAVGSFLNVVIYRVPRGLSVAKPTHSFCPKCKSRLTALDLIPILSWLFLGSKCRHCKAPVSSRYFWVEVINASLWAAIWWQQLCQANPVVIASIDKGHDLEMYGDPVRAIAYMLFASALVAAIFTDLAHYIIPDQINAFLLFVGLAMNGIMIAQNRAEAWAWGIPASIAGALTGIGVLWGIAFLGRIAFRKDAMGHGDIKMARGIGAVLFPFLSLVSFGVAVVFGAVTGLLVVVLRKVLPTQPAQPEEEGDEPYEPESIGSLFKCGLGYLLCVDVIGLLFPKLYESWFGEDPYAIEEFEEEPQVELTMIPFGPSLAAGALAAVLFAKPLTSLVENYFRSIYGGN